MNSRKIKKRRKARPAPPCSFEEAVTTVDEFVCAACGPGKATRDGGVRRVSVDFESVVAVDTSSVRLSSKLAAYLGSPT